MDCAAAINAARRRAGLTQVELAARAGTSQATLSDYETGRRAPSVGTLVRLLGAAGARLAVEPAERPVVHARPDRLARSGRHLAQVLELAEALPTRHEPDLRFPRLEVRHRRAA